MHGQIPMLFCVEIELESEAIIFHHCVAKTSTEAFEKTEGYLQSKNLKSSRLSCTILNIVDGYKIELKEENSND